MPRQLKKIFFLLCYVFFVACRPRFTPEPVYTTFNDFDSQVGWYSCNSNNSFIVEKTEAYSGIYATHIKNGHDFGYIYKVNIEDLGVDTVTWVKYSSMCKKKSGGIEYTAITCEVKDSLGQTKAWMDVPCKFKLVERNVWTNVEARFNLKGLNRKGNTIAIFIWNRGSFEELIQDDIRVDFYK